MNALEKENVASDVTETEMNLMYLYAIEFLNNSYKKGTRECRAKLGFKQSTTEWPSHFAL